MGDSECNDAPETRLRTRGSTPGDTGYYVIIAILIVFCI